MLLLDDLEKLHAVQPRPLHPDVQKDQLGTSRLDGRKRLVGIPGRARVMALIGKDARNTLTNVRFVVDDQNVCRHTRYAFCLKS